MQDLISVIVPIYKVEQYLVKCIDSILKQTYQNLEIILVEDGSPDNCGRICDEYKLKDNRIKVIHKKNGGLSDARNAGLNIFTGKYVTFIDSDDWISEDYIEYLYYLIKKYQADVAVCEFINITETGKKINVTLDNEEEFYLKSKEAVQTLLKSEFFATSAWGKLYTKELFQTLRFPVGKLYEDIPVTYNIFLSDINVVFGARSLYYYFYRTSAISKSTFTPQRMDAIHFVESAMKLVLNKYPEFKELTDIRLFCVYFSLLCSFDKSSASKKYYKVVKPKINNLRKKVIFSSQSTATEKKKAICSYLNYRLIKYIIRLRINRK